MLKDIQDRFRSNINFWTLNYLDNDICLFEENIKINEEDKKYLTELHPEVIVEFENKISQVLKLSDEFAVKKELLVEEYENKILDIVK
jgi:hypothetical protein